MLYFLFDIKADIKDHQPVFIEFVYMILKARDKTIIFYFWLLSYQLLLNTLAANIIIKCINRDHYVDCILQYKR